MASIDQIMEGGLLDGEVQVHLQCRGTFEQGTKPLTAPRTPITVNPFCVRGCISGKIGLLMLINRYRECKLTLRANRTVVTHWLPQTWINASDKYLPHKSVRCLFLRHYYFETA